MSKHNNPPAFPRPFSHDAMPANAQYFGDGPSHDEAQEGMTLRDYFAAHAPEPPEWFSPTMPPKPRLPSWMDYLPYVPEVYDAVARFFDGGAPEEFVAEVPPEDREAAQVFVAAWKEADRARHEWNAADRLLQTIVQWRWHYADAMLAAREKGTNP